jgi:Flp pilus assembly protein TadD/ADP-heptose:LPS heptosyltransferase
MTALLDQATTLHNQGRFDEAVRLYRALLADETMQADFAEAHYKLALILEKQNKFSEAAQHVQQALQIMPDHGALWTKLSEIALKNADYELANNAAENAVRLMPDNLAAHTAHALALDGLDRQEEAVIALQNALRIKPDFVEAWSMLGSAYQQMGRLGDAESTFRKTIEVAGAVIPDESKREVAEEEYSVHHWNLAVLELLRGDFTKGFAHYRARFKKSGRAQRLPFPRPLWRGEDLRGKKILAVGEQGFGDVLMMCRYLPLLKAKGTHVVLLAHEALAPLLRLGNIADEIIYDAPSAQGNFDFQTSLFDLPYRFGTTLETIPADVAYLPCPSADEATKLADTGRPKIGIVWAGRQDFGNDRRRSIPLSAFAKLFDTTDSQFYNLTRELKPGDTEFMAQHSIIDLSSKLSDFLVTARLIAQLDLVITCDTAMAHLAGGMGKKTWVLLPFAPDWRWLTTREDSPWYPQMRLFRQRKTGDWHEVITRMGKACADLPLVKS